MKNILKMFIFISLIIIASTAFSKQVEAKIFTKDLVDKVTLDSGYKLTFCSIDISYDVNAAQNANFFIVPEKDFEANPQNYPCNKKDQQDILFGNITLHFNQVNGGGISQEKVILYQNKLYAVDNFGSIFDPDFPDSKKTTYNDLSTFDWFSTLTGIHGIRGGNLIDTDPGAKGNFIPNSTTLILHDPSTGTYASALFVINGIVYKLSNIVSQVTTSTTLVDYTHGSTPPPPVSETPIPIKAY